jgi:hypothetical protein
LALAGQVEPATVLPAQTQYFLLSLRLVEDTDQLHLHRLVLRALLALAALVVALQTVQVAREIPHQ